MTSIAAASVGEYQVGGIGIHMKDHVTSKVPDDSIGIGGGIIHEHFARTQSLLGGGRLCRPNFIDGGEHGRI